VKIMDPLTRDQLLNLTTVVNLTTAARALGIGRTKAYELAQRRQFPCRVLRVGHSYHVPTAGLLEVLGSGHLREHTPGHQETATPRQ
jgi:predicted DNA-binding transcriptional regulator AlpA